MACITCTRVCPVPKCTTTISVGSISSFLTAVNVFIEHPARDKRIVVPVTTGAAGEIDLPMDSPDPDFWAIGFDYRVWVVLASSSNIYDLEIINFPDTPASGITATCVEFKVVELLDASFDPESLATVELVTIIS